MEKYLSIMDTLGTVQCCPELRGELITMVKFESK
jgi:hypothetical protein